MTIHALFQYKALQAERHDRRRRDRGRRPAGSVPPDGRPRAAPDQPRRERRNGQSRKAESRPRQPATIQARVDCKLSFGGADKITARMLENFTRLLSSLLAAGVPLSRALVILAEGSGSSRGRARSGRKSTISVVDGMSLADAMAKSPETFPRVYVAMVEAGETGGFLDVVLAQIADFQAREKEMRAKVMTALLYPIILLVPGARACWFSCWSSSSRVSRSIFAGFGAHLPLLTQIIVGDQRCPALLRFVRRWRRSSSPAS